MTINSTKMGPGVLTIGTAPVTLQAQVKSATLQVTEAVQSSDPVPVLSGETLAGSDVATYTYALAVTFLQDLGQPAASGVVGYTWANAGQTKAFVFTPSNAAAAGSKSWSGNLRVMPINVGGDVGPDPLASDVTFAIIGTPVMA